MRLSLLFCLTAWAAAQNAEFILPDFPLEDPLNIACLSPQTGTISIEVLNASSAPVARLERVLKVQTWHNWPIYPGGGAGKGSLRVRLAGNSLNGFLFIGRSQPISTADLPAPPLCPGSCFQLLPSAAPKLGRFGFTLSNESTVSARIVAGSNPPRVLFEENLGRRPAGFNAYDWNLVLHPPSGANHVGLFLIAGSKEFVLVFAHVEK